MFNYRLIALLILATFLSCTSKVKKSYPEIADLMERQYPMFVKASPQGDKILLKEKGLESFQLYTSEMPTSGFTKIDSSDFTQLSLTWHPSGNEIFLQEFNPISRMYDLFKIDLRSKKKAKVDLPSSINAIPPLKWSKNGEYLAYLSTGMGSKLHIYDHQTNKIKQSISQMDVYSDFQWSGDSLVYFVQDYERPVLTSINMITKEERKYELLKAGNVKKISVAGNIVLFVGRPEFDEYFQCYSLNTQNGAITKLTNSKFNISNCSFSDKGDVFYYNQNENGVEKLYCSDPSINDFLSELSKAYGSLTIDVNHEESLFVKSHTLSYAPGLLKIDTRLFEKVIKYEPHNAGYLSLGEPEFIQIERANTPIKIPSFFWKADYMDLGSKTVIYIHGGPYLQSKPLWDARTKLLTEFGFNLLVVNYHGSSGYSKRFSELNSESNQVSDILAAVEYLKDEHDIKPEDIILMGSSYGGKIALEVIDSMENLGGVVLISGLTDVKIENIDRLKKTKILGFYGDLDNLSLAAKEFFRENNLKISKPENFKIFKNEGHLFHRSSSWVYIYGTIIDSFTEDDTPQLVPN